MITQEELAFLEEEVNIARRKLKKAQEAYDKFEDKVNKQNEPDLYPPAIERVMDASRKFEAFVTENAEKVALVSDNDLLFMARTLYAAEVELAQVEAANFEEEQKFDALRTKISDAQKELKYKIELVNFAKNVNDALAKFKPKYTDVLI